MSKALRGLFFINLLLLLSGTVFDKADAVMASPALVDIEQPDGTVIKAKMRGDERLHWMETEDGYTIVKDKASGYWFYAVKDETEGIIKGDFPVRSIDPELLGIPKGLKPSGMKRMISPLFPRTARISPPLPHQQNILVIMVDFNNQPYTYSESSFQQEFFSDLYRSVKGYYGEVSYGSFTIIPAMESYGTSNDGVVGWLHLNQNHPDCENSSNPDSCYQNLASAAISASDPYVNFASYDSNNDGKITPDELSIILVIAGKECAYGGVSSPCIWAHQWELWSPVVLDGKSIRHYAMFGERHLDHQATIGVIVHELGHLMLGLPDLYDTDFSSRGAGDFDVMASGSWCKSSIDSYWGESPVHPSAWSKEYAGFINPDVISNGMGINLPAVSGSPTAIKIQTQDPFQYFLLENRFATGYDEGLQGCLGFSALNGGIAIWHIDGSLLSGCIPANTCNDDENHKLVDLEEADGVQDLDTPNGSSKLKDLFYAGNNATFNDSSNPNSRLYGNLPSYVSVTNVSSSGLNMTLDVTTIQPLPDLTAQWTTVVKRGPMRDGSYQVTGSLSVMNQGSVNASNVLVNIYLSEDDSLDATDTLLRSITLGNVRKGRAARIRLSRVNLPTDPAGKYLIAVVDPLNNITESDENNNKSSMIIP